MKRIIKIYWIHILACVIGISAGLLFIGCCDLNPNNEWVRGWMYVVSGISYGVIGFIFSIGA